MKLIDPFVLGHPANLLTRLGRYFYKEVDSIGAGCVVVNNKNQVLLIHRGDIYNDWTFPKGKVQNNNLEKEALRETFEEVGVLPKIVSKLPSNKYSFYIDKQRVRKNNTVHFFLAKTNKLKFSIVNNIDSEEAKTFIEAKWIDFEKSLELVSHETERIILRAAIKALKL